MRKTDPKNKEKEIKEKCNHKWYGKRYCQECGNIEIWGKITCGMVSKKEIKKIKGQFNHLRKSNEVPECL